MTASKELHERIDRLTPEQQQEVQAFLDAKEARHQRELAELAQLLDGLSEPMPEDEKRELLSDLERKSWRTPVEDAT